MTWQQPSRPWQGGRWSVELRDDELADLRLDGRIVLRSIRAVVRDRNWDTATLVIDDLRESHVLAVDPSIADPAAAVSGQTDTLLELAVHTEGLDAHFDGTVHVEASSDTITVTAELVSRTEFLTNRVGLVVLHPPQNAGSPLTVLHSDGSDEQTRFPLEISPHQPVFDIAGLDWTADGVELEVRFDGDVFEMEDQRNWTDASYKTYSRPLGLPYPYRIAAGETVRQSIRVRGRDVGESSPDVAPATPAVPPHAAGPQAELGPPAEPLETRLVLAPAALFPTIALGASTAPDPTVQPADTATPATRPPAPLGAAVFVELDLATPNWRAALARATTSRLPLDVRLVPDPDHTGELTAAAEALRGHPIARVATFEPDGEAAHVSDAPVVAALRAALDGAGVDAPVVGGARSHFTELNREQHRLPDDLDGVTFSVTPLFHSLRTEQLVESIAMQRLVAEQGVRIAAGAPVHIGPVSLRPRFNNVATTPPPRPTRDDLSEGYGPELLDTVDPRQSAPELAAWTIASAAALAVPGVASLTYFEEWGPRGIRSAADDEFPVARALRAVDDLRGGTLLSGTSSPDGLLWALGAVLPSAELSPSGPDLEHEYVHEIETPTRTETETVHEMETLTKTVTEMETPTKTVTETVLVANLDRHERTVLVATPTGERRVTLAPLSWARLS